MLWNETAFPLCSAMDSCQNKYNVGGLSGVTSDVGRLFPPVNAKCPLLISMATGKKIVGC